VTARGCLLAGAVGDALGAPVEFDTLDAIRRTHGPAGLVDLVPSAYGRAGLVTDDTQMTLFTAEALLEPGDLPAALAAPPAGATGLAAQSWLYAQRAPGNACLSGLRSRRTRPDVPVNVDSKGCGTVMRSAPFGLTPRLADPDAVADAAIAGSVLTHGHPTAGISAAALAVLVHHLVAGRDLPGALAATVPVLAARPGHEETVDALRRAVDAAASGAELGSLGEGWVAEEALAMSVFCALRHPEDLRAALLLAVNHDGDTDSTGAITGNLLGARHGEAAVPPHWAAQVEGRETILALGDRLATGR
jgi:ADP-ribosylglycohydrolase